MNYNLSQALRSKHDEVTREGVQGLTATVRLDVEVCSSGIKRNEQVGRAVEVERLIRKSALQAVVMAKRAPSRQGFAT